jgi:hypothetical protein
MIQVELNSKSKLCGWASKSNALLLETSTRYLEKGRKNDL